MLALGAVVVGEEGEPSVVEPLEQQDTAMGTAITVDRGEGHGIGLHRWLLGLYRIGEPLMEQC
ncbi:hypothetical protein D3C73_1311360 [compost metagenome]